MKLISTERDYGKIESIIINLIEQAQELPSQVFKSTLNYFLFITFDDLFMPSFFNYVKQFIREVGEDDFWIAVIDPDPRNYFSKNFTFFGVVNFVCTDTEEDFISALNDFPHESPADAIIHNSNSLIVSSSGADWVIYGNRESDIAVCAFSSSDKMEVFREIYGADLLAGVEAAASYAYENSDDISRFNEFVKNYKAQ